MCHFIIRYERYGEKTETMPILGYHGYTLIIYRLTSQIIVTSSIFYIKNLGLKINGLISNTGTNLITLSYT